jgi:hypothetical protein
VSNTTKNDKNKTRKHTHIKFYKVTAAAMLMYGSENWALNRFERRKIETAEMCFLMHVSGYTVIDHVCSTSRCNALPTYML